MNRLTRRALVRGGIAAGAAFSSPAGGPCGRPRPRRLPSGAPPLDPLTIPKYVEPLVIPPAMPQAPQERRPAGLSAETDYYEIAVRQFQQHDPPGESRSADDRLELRRHRPARLVQLPRLHDRGDGGPAGAGGVDQRAGGRQRQLPAPPPAGRSRRSTGPTRAVARPAGTSRPSSTATPGPYTGPVPIVVHLHGGHNTEESDGYTEAWYLPAARNLPAGFAADRHDVRRVRGQVRRAVGPGVAAGDGGLPVRQRPAAGHPLVPRSHPGHDPPQRLCRSGRLLPPAGRCSRTCPPAPCRRPASSPGNARPTRFRSPSRTAPSPPTARSSTRRAAPSSMTSPVPTSPRAMCRRSGTRRSSATRWWSMAAPGRCWRSSRAATGCGS